MKTLLYQPRIAWSGDDTQSSEPFQLFYVWTKLSSRFSSSIGKEERDLSSNLFFWSMLRVCVNERASQNQFVVTRTWILFNAADLIFSAPPVFNIAMLVLQGLSFSIISLAMNSQLQSLPSHHSSSIKIRFDCKLFTALIITIQSALVILHAASF